MTDKRQCPECLKWYGRKRYNNGVLEPPVNFNRSKTCGENACIQSRRMKQNAEKKSRAMQADAAVNYFLYGVNSC